MPIAVGAMTLFALIATAIVAARYWSSGKQTVAQSRSEMILRPTQVSPVQTAPPFQDEIALRPLPVALTTATHEWTEADATDLGVIERIAHNPDEALRMLEENDRIERRQLVYRKKTADESLRQAREAGEPLRQLVLPSLDGHEVVFEIARADLHPSGQSGTFAGRVPGRMNSQVTLAFKDGREAFTVISPDDDLYLQADPREPGELIVKAINPATYIEGHCGNPDHDH